MAEKYSPDANETLLFLLYNVTISGTPEITIFVGTPYGSGL
jgi:hypothetical protein